MRIPKIHTWNRKKENLSIGQDFLRSPTLCLLHHTITIALMLKISHHNLLCYSELDMYLARVWLDFSLFFHIFGGSFGGHIPISMCQIWVLQEE